MRLLEFVAHVFVVWLVVATIVAGAWCVAVTRLKARRPKVTPPLADDTAFSRYLPPVPPPTCRYCELEDDLLADLPVSVDAWLTPELSDRLFAEHIAMEGLQ